MASRRRSWDCRPQSRTGAYERRADCIWVIRMRTQRDVMREIVKRYGMNRDRVVAEYADAERRGEAPRRRNTSGLSADEYARALWADGVKKEWLE